MPDTPQKTVIFLGAGASAAEEAPMQAALFKSYFNDVLPRVAQYYPRQDTSRLLEMQKEFQKLFGVFFGIDITQDLPVESFPTFEQVLGIIQLAIQRGETFVGFGQQNQSARLRYLEDSLGLLISVVLDAKLRGGGRYHQQLVRKLAENGNEFRNTSFISLNYDIVLDNALSLVRDENPAQFDIDYTVDFTNFRHERLNRALQPWPIPDPSRAIKLVKPHGSLNWLYCSTCTNVTLTPGIKGVVKGILEPKRFDCPECGCKTTPIIVLPTFFKSMTNFHLQRVWRAAQEVLQTADRIIFCGYSLPDADIHIRYLLKRGELNRSHLKAPPKVIIVNHHSRKKKEDAKGEEKRFKSAFIHAEHVCYTRLSFQTFSNHGFAALDGLEIVSGAGR